MNCYELLWWSDGCILIGTVWIVMRCSDGCILIGTVWIVMRCSDGCILIGTYELLWDDWWMYTYRYCMNCYEMFWWMYTYRWLYELLWDVLMDVYL